VFSVVQAQHSSCLLTMRVHASLYLWRILLFIMLLCSPCLLVRAQSPSPPVLPTAFSVSINLTSTSWGNVDNMQVYYTWDYREDYLRRQRADHTNFMDTGDVVSLYFLDERVYMVSRVTSSCCILFATNMQATPDWLSSARYLGTQEIYGEEADTWYQNGYTWYDATDTTTPLQWTFQLLPSRPLITATLAWFTVRPQPDNLFNPPTTCKSALICPIPYPDQAEAGIWNDSIVNATPADA